VFRTSINYVGSMVGHYGQFVTEFMGTYLLVFTIGINSTTTDPSPAQSVLTPLAIGSTLMCCVFLGGHISGGHYNPAVTWGVRLSGRGKISLRDSFIYTAVQCLGSLLAGFTYWGINGDTFAIFPHSSTEGKAFAVEIIWTFFLVYVVLNVATTKSNNENSFYGLAIGFTVFSGAVTVGPISGGCFNPAVGFGPIIVNALDNGSSELKHIWIYWLAPLMGAVIAAALFRITTYYREFGDMTGLKDTTTSALVATTDSPNYQREQNGSGQYTQLKA